MKRGFLVLLLAVAFAPLAGTTEAQTLTNPGGIRGVPPPVVPGGGLASPIGSGPSIQPTLPGLKPTIPVIPAPKVNTNGPGGSGSRETEAPDLPTGASRESETRPDGDSEASSFKAPSPHPTSPAGGDGGPDAKPPASSQSDEDFPWWILIAVGVLAIVLYRLTRRRSAY
jgi:hypothetical protein